MSQLGHNIKCYGATITVAYLKSETFILNCYAMFYLLLAHVSIFIHSFLVTQYHELKFLNETFIDIKLKLSVILKTVSIKHSFVM